MSLMQSFARGLFASAKESATSLNGRCTQCFVTIKRCVEGGSAQPSSCQSCVLEICASCVQHHTICGKNKKNVDVQLCTDCAEEIQKSDTERKLLLRTLERRASEKRKSKDDEAGGRRSRRRVVEARDIFGPGSIDDPPEPVQTQMSEDGADATEAEQTLDEDSEDTVDVATPLINESIFVFSLLGGRPRARFNVEQPGFLSGSRQETDGLQSQGLQMQSQNANADLPPLQSAFSRASRTHRNLRTYADRGRRSQVTQN